MSNRIVQVYYGKGKGKTTAAVGLCIREASLGHSVIIIQFLKGKDAEEFCFLKRLEPEIKLFRFEKEQEFYSDLSEARKNEEKKNILNGFHFARKVIDTGECDVLILDEVLGLVDLGIITLDDIIKLIDLKDDYCKLVLTGQNMEKALVDHVDLISKIEQIKVPNP
jgi:ATP:corrinoid adenosyltransferase